MLGRLLKSSWFLPLILLAVAFVAFVLYRNSYLSQTFENRIRNRAAEIVQSAYLMCETTDKLLHKRVSLIESQAEEVLAELASAPDLSDEKSTLIVTELAKRAGGGASLFARFGTDSFECAASTEPEGCRQGERPSAAALPGPGDRMRANLLSGEIIYRPEYHRDQLLLCVYLPVVAQDKVSAILRVRTKDANLPRLYHDLLTTRVGRTGYIYVLKATGANRGTYIISRNGERDGETIWEEVDAAGRPFIQKVILAALRLRSSSEAVSVPMAFERYPWRNPGEVRARFKTAAFTYFEPWDWVIGAGYYEDEIR